MATYNASIDIPVNTTLPVVTEQFDLPVAIIATELDFRTFLWAIFNGVLFVCILAGNFLTIVSLRVCRRLRSMISNLFILSLAVSDFVVGLTLPYQVSFYLGFGLGDSHFLCMLRFFLIIFACCVSVLTLITIAIDRYIAIVFALHYRCYMTRRVAISIITFSWLTGAAAAAIPMFWNHWSTASHCEFVEVLPPWYLAGIITPGFVLLWVLMLFVYGRIMREASKQVQQLRNAQHKSRRTSHLTPNWKSMQVFVFVTGSFSICWLPYFIVTCIQIFGYYNESTLPYRVAFILAVMNSALNPIIYCWKNSNYRHAFVQLLHCKDPNSGLNKLDFSQHHVRSEASVSQQKPEIPRTEVVTEDGATVKEAPSMCGTEYAAAVICSEIWRKTRQLQSNILQSTGDDKLNKYTIKGGEIRVSDNSDFSSGGSQGGETNHNNVASICVICK